MLPKSTLSPRIHACLVRLGTELPFERVPDLARLLLGVQVSVETVRRLTEAAGAAQVEREAAERDRIRRDLPAGPDGPAVQQLSADGAMVPLVHGEWAEVRTIVLGTIEPGGAEATVKATDLRSFSRLCSAADFIDWASLPLHQAGTARAGTVVAVQDGAEWLQELVEAHCPDAIRILDFPHAAEYLADAAHAALGTGTVEATTWITTQLHDLKHEDPDEVLAALRALPTPSPEATEARETALGYLQKRRAQIAYAAFRAQGYPIGSGIVESGNKLVVEQRMKGSGMHWARKHVTPMLALRGVLCNGEWETVWLTLWRQLQMQAYDRQRRHRDERRAARRAPEEQTDTAESPPAKVLRQEPPKMVDGRPTEHHPWHQGYDQRLTQQAAAKS